MAYHKFPFENIVKVTIEFKPNQQKIYFSLYNPFGERIMSYIYLELHNQTIICKTTGTAITNKH